MTLISDETQKEYGPKKSDKVQHFDPPEMQTTCNLDELYPDGNPKTAEGRKKTPLRLVPPEAIIQEAHVFKLGAEKYGAYNWRKSGVSSSVYYEAAMRHLMAWYEGEDIDPESGITHLAHVRACMAIVIDANKRGKLNDDRP